MLARLRTWTAGRIKANVIAFLEGLLDLYFVNRGIDWYPAHGRPVLQARIVNTRRVGEGFYQVLIETALAERRWVDVRRGKRDDKSGRWAFYEE